MIRAVETLSELQTKIGSAVMWVRAFEDHASVQRSYIWSMNRMAGLGLGERTEVMLRGLAMDVSSASQERMETNQRGDSNK